MRIFDDLKPDMVCRSTYSIHPREYHDSWTSKLIKVYDELSNQYEDGWSFCPG